MLRLCAWWGYRVRGLNFRKGLAPRLFCFRWLPPPRLFWREWWPPPAPPRPLIMLERPGDSAAMLFLAGEAVIRDGMGEKRAVAPACFGECVFDPGVTRPLMLPLLLFMLLLLPLLLLRTGDRGCIVRENSASMSSSSRSMALCRSTRSRSRAFLRFFWFAATIAAFLFSREYRCRLVSISRESFAWNSDDLASGELEDKKLPSSGGSAMSPSMSPTPCFPKSELMDPSIAEEFWESISLKASSDTGTSSNFFSVKEPSSLLLLVSRKLLLLLPLFSSSSRVNIILADSRLFRSLRKESSSTIRHGVPSLRGKS
mmetsp:Transcript_10388/g.24302  ORF Transcript_10388/g.24302 Transcript_10388/m.24302 type:complete len:314 (-) Transcript_10388:312-1253(-)